MKRRNNITRREFLASSGLVAGASLLANGGVRANANDVTTNASVDDVLTSANVNRIPNSWESLLRDSHDLQLPSWGTYTKTFNGISHVADKEKGIRFDVAVMTGFYRRRVLIPNVRWESNYHPFEASANLEWVKYRYELEWKDRVYADVGLARIDDNSRLIACEYVNNTDVKQNVVLHLMASLNFPNAQVRSDAPLVLMNLSLPERAVWRAAVDYKDLIFARPRPTDNLVYDGWQQAEVRGNGFTSGGGIGAGFGKDAGDKVVYGFEVTDDLTDAVLLIRYRLIVEKDKPNNAARFEIKGIVNTNVDFVFLKDNQANSANRSGDVDAKVDEYGFAVQAIKIGKVARGNREISLVSQGGAGIEFDAFVLLEANAASQVKFDVKATEFTPEITTNEKAQTLILKYQDAPRYYGLRWAFAAFEVREFYTDELDRFMQYTAHDHVSKTLRDGASKRHYANLFLRPVTLEANRKKTLYAAVCDGATREEVERRLASIDLSEANATQVINRAKQSVEKITANEAGKGYELGQRLMHATVLTNVVFPVYTRRSYIKHYTPGRWWGDFLYTWDAGFIGLGLAEINLERAVDCLNAYTTPAGDKQHAFIHHGSPVPVQIYLFQELWNRTQSKELLAYFYPRLRQYHAFLAGRLGSSTTRKKFKSNVLATWDYFYNSGGWDDYPPQKYMHANKLTNRIAPVVNTAHAIRTAKILRQMALMLDKQKSEITEFDNDITTFSDALQKHSWDAPSGYFGYVTHDEQGAPSGILKHESTVNFNMGLDGAAPLISGICNAAQQRIIIERLQDKRRLWTPIGLSTVDRSAPYFTSDGYWNGAVWMPHQWFIWKTMLDLGHGDFAYKIAKTALDLWQRETETSYNCFEHFLIASERGAGWHQFGALSSPVLAWFAAYHTPGRLTVGFDAWITKQEFSNDNKTLEATITLDNSNNSVQAMNMIATMNESGSYAATWNDKKVDAKTILPGVLQITVPRNAMPRNAGNAGGSPARLRISAI